METKKIIIIGILLVIICILFGAIFGLLTNNVTYERIEITPNGTSIEVPSEDAKYDGEVNNTGAKMWTFKQGALMTFNSEEAIDARGLNGLGGAVGFKDIKDIVLTHFEKQETIDGFTIYTLNGEQLGINGRGTMYCIITGNDQTHDNIIITVDNKDVALHMAKSIQYKTGNITSNTNLTDDGHTSSDNLSSTPTNAIKTPSEDLVKPDTATSDGGYDNAPSEEGSSEVSSSSSSDSSSDSSSSNAETTTDESSSSSSSSSNVETSTG